MTQIASRKRDVKHTISATAQERLVLDHMPIVRAIASRIRSGMPAVVELDDLVQAGVLGLLDACAKYDPSKANEFRTYAKFRIRGAILDSLRQLDMAPRMLRIRQRNVEAATRELTATLKRDPEEAEVAEQLGVKVEALRKTRADVADLNFVSVSPGASELDGVASTFEVPAKPECEPEHATVQQELRSVLAQTIHQLPKRQQEVVHLYYAEDLTMKQVGSHLAVKESRISQIHAKALAQLGKMLEEAGISSSRSFVA